jgi:hypothetical protein
MYLSCRRLIFSAVILTGLATSAFAQGDGDRVERGSQLATEAAAVLYEEDPAEPAGRRYVGSAAWRTETVTPETGQPPRACNPSRYRSAGAQARADLVPSTQHGQKSVRDAHHRDHVQATGGFRPGRHF